MFSHILRKHARSHIQCPVLHLSLSPCGGRFLLAQDLEGGLAFFCFDDNGDAIRGPLNGGRLAGLPVETTPAADSDEATATVAMM